MRVCAVGLTVAAAVETVADLAAGRGVDGETLRSGFGRDAAWVVTDGDEHHGGGLRADTDEFEEARAGSPHQGCDLSLEGFGLGVESEAPLSERHERALGGLGGRGESPGWGHGGAGTDQLRGAQVPEEPKLT